MAMENYEKIIDYRFFIIEIIVVVLLAHTIGAFRKSRQIKIQFAYYKVFLLYNRLVPHMSLVTLEENGIGSL